jgi:YVTN family beta-propeller protein
VALDAEPIAVAVTPDGSRLYVTVSLSDRHVLVIDTATQAVTDSLSVEGDTIALAPDGHLAYLGSSVLDIDPSSDTYHMVVAHLPAVCDDISLTRDGTRAYCGVVDSGLFIIDTDPASPTYLTVVGHVNGVASSSPVVFSPDGTLAYAPGLRVIDTASYTVVATIPVNGLKLVITPDGGRVYVADKIISVIDTMTFAVHAILDLRIIPNGFAITPDGGQLYAAIPCGNPGNIC